MNLRFSKYHGTGNDFVLIDNLNGSINLEISQIRHICDRHLGVGSDGLILIEKSSLADYNMNFYNPDGSQSYCGNGSRCAHAFAIKLGIVGAQCHFEAIDGIHSAQYAGEQFRISLGDVTEVEELSNDLVLNTGSPHYVSSHADLSGMDLVAQARVIRYNDRFAAEGINVNFISQTEQGIAMRTYERGVEGETLSCGTGVTAAGIAAHHLGQAQSPVSVSTSGGNLKVYFDFGSEGYTNIRLEGPVKHVFDGQIEL